MLREKRARKIQESTGDAIDLPTDKNFSPLGYHIACIELECIIQLPSELNFAYNRVVRNCVVIITPSPFDYII